MSIELWKGDVIYTKYMHAKIYGLRPEYITEVRKVVVRLVSLGVAA